MKSQPAFPQVCFWSRGFILAVGLILVTTNLARAGLTNRWSFNNPAGSAPDGTTLVDSVSGAVAVIRGQNGVFDGGNIVLPGNTVGTVPNAQVAAYVDLSNYLLSSKTNASVEVWATVLSAQGEQVLFDFGSWADPEWTGNSSSGPDGRSPIRELYLDLETPGGGFNQLFFYTMLDGGSSTRTTFNASTSLHVQYHYVLTYQQGLPDNPDGGTFSWYRNGTLLGTTEVGQPLNFLLDDNAWVGRSEITSRPLSNIAVNELRVYDHALTPEEVAADYAAGPNPTYPAPTANLDQATLQHGQKIPVPVLQNDSGNYSPASVAIAQPPSHGTAVPLADGRILYANNPDDPATSDTFSYNVSYAGFVSNNATVTVNFTPNLRLPAIYTNVPADAPASSIQVVNAFPTLSFSAPVCLVSPPGDVQRLFVCERFGKIKLISDVASSTPTAVVFLDLAALLTARRESFNPGAETGLLGLAFHPKYASNGYFYIYYTVTKTDHLTYDRLSRFSVQSANPNAADASSELVLIEQLDRSPGHNGGCLAFGPDGYLYVGLGDEGAGIRRA